MNKNALLIIVLLTLSACHSNNSRPQEEVRDTSSQADTVKNPQSRSHTDVILSETFSSKGTIEAVNQVPVYSRITEQIVMLGVEMGQRVKKGQTLVRLDETAIREKILVSRAELERAENKYQAILMGQGYKHGQLEQAPSELKRLARINSGYNTAEATLHELEHRLTYCTITAPISGAVTELSATLYGAANPGVALFQIVDTEHLKVRFDILESELPEFLPGSKVKVSTIAFPDEEYIGTVSAISPDVDANGMIHIEATIPSGTHLMPGMSAMITL